MGYARENRSAFRRVWLLAVRRVAGDHCPQCGRGGLFQCYARLRERCDVCGLVFRREDGAELGAMYLAATVNQLFAAAVFLAIWLGTDWTFWPAVLISVPVVLAFGYTFLPWSMRLWTAVEYTHDVGNRAWWARQRE